MKNILVIVGIAGLLLGLACSGWAQTDRLYPIFELTDEDVALIDIHDGSIADWLEVVGEPTLTTVAGVFGGKDNYVFTIDGETHQAPHWRTRFAERLEKDRWGCDVPVYRTPAVRPTFGQVTLIFCRRKGERKVSYFLLTHPLRTAEAVRILHQPHWIEVFWKRCKGLFKLADSKLHTPQGARAGVGIKGVGYLLLLRLQIALKRYRRFARISMDRRVTLCQHFFDPIPVFQAHFHLLPIDNISINQYLRTS